jgi:hypothetical protein
VDELRADAEVVISTVAVRKFHRAGARHSSFDDTLGPSLWSFLDHFGFANDVRILSYPVGLVSWRSHAVVKLRKLEWTTRDRFQKVVGTMWRELRDPPSGR